MKNLKLFYNKYPLSVNRNDYLKQVGHTVNGQSISDRDFKQITAYISNLLDLQKTDIVLDLCCGNGLISKEIAKKCQKVVGVDFSKPLIQIAKQNHNPANVSYRQMDILEINPSEIAEQKFTKILMFGALQHFQKGQLETILNNIRMMSSESPTILFGLVPNRSKKWSFYNTPVKKMKHFLRLLLQKELIGTWWDKTYIDNICQNMGMSCSFHELDSKLNAGNYRFEIKIS